MSQRANRNVRIENFATATTLSFWISAFGTLESNVGWRAFPSLLALQWRLFIERSSSEPNGEEAVRKVIKRRIKCSRLMMRTRIDVSSAGHRRRLLQEPPCPRSPIRAPNLVEWKAYVWMLKIWRSDAVGRANRCRSEELWNSELKF